MGSVGPLALKLKSLGIDDGDLNALVQVTKHRARVAAGADVIRAGDTVKRAIVLLDGIAGAYERSEDGGRSILAFQLPGYFCDLYRYVLPERDSAAGVQALTDFSIAVIDYRDMD